jgi:thiazole synthase
MTDADKALAASSLDHTAQAHSHSGLPADTWRIGDTVLHSRFLLGTAQYPSPQVLRQAIEASGSQVLTLGLKRTLAVHGGGDNGFVQIIRDTAQARGAHLLPNTAGCRSAHEAVMLAHMARELLGTHWIKLEVVGDEQTLQPDPFELVEAARQLVKDGFEVLPIAPMTWSARSVWLTLAAAS